MNQNNDIEGWTFEDLANAIGDLKYDRMVEFFDELSKVFVKAGLKAKHTDPALSRQLFVTVQALNDISDSIPSE